MSTAISRRGFLEVASAGVACAAAAQVGLTRRAWASPLPTTVKRLLILHAGGGARTACLFNADVAAQYSPLGAVRPGDVDATGAPILAAGTQWGVGRALLGLAIGETPSALRPRSLATWGGAVLPYVSQIADRISVLGAVDHDPTQLLGDTDHLTATRRMCTGAPDGRVGLLTLFGKALDTQYALPPVIVGGSGPVGASVYGLADEENARYRPLWVEGLGSLRDVGTLPGRSDPDWATSLASLLDDGYVRDNPRALGGRPGEHVLDKQIARHYETLLASDSLRITSADATLGTLTSGAPLSNAMLADLFDLPVAGSPAPGAADVGGDASGAGPWGEPTALAVRLLQLGAPAVAVGVGGWDAHAGEQAALGRLGRSLGRAMAALYFLFSQLEDDGAPGHSYWDTTLVVFTSEFGRDNTAETADDGATLGFNQYGGSDHHGTRAGRLQALPLMGGGVRGGQLVAPTDRQLRPTGATITSGSLLSTMTAALGLDPAAYFSAPPLTQVWG